MLVATIFKKINNIERINPWSNRHAFSLESAIAERAIINKILELCGD